MKSKPKRKNILYMVSYSNGYCEPLVADGIVDLKNKYFDKQIKHGFFTSIIPIARSKN